MRATAIIVLALASAACGELPAGSMAEVPQADACTDVPVQTYDNFGKAFLTTQCNACHASSALDRHGAPPDVTFDDRDQAFTFSSRILARAGGEDPTMPPSGGVTEDDRLRLETWLTCFND